MGFLNEGTATDIERSGVRRAGFEDVLQAVSIHCMKTFKWKIRITIVKQILSLNMELEPTSSW